MTGSIIFCPYNVMTVFLQRQTQLAVFCSGVVNFAQKRIRTNFAKFCVNMNQLGNADAKSASCHPDFVRISKPLNVHFMDMANCEICSVCSQMIPVKPRTLQLTPAFHSRTKFPHLPYSPAEKSSSPPLNFFAFKTIIYWS